MAIEAKRGCGYRKVGGLYIVGGEIMKFCDRLPIPLETCPCCGEGIKFSRGWTWIQPVKLFEGNHGVANGLDSDCTCNSYCPVCWPTINIGNGNKSGLLWVGSKHYTPDEFLAEGAQLGISRRISAIPRDFKLGETYVFFAHIAGASKPTEDNQSDLFGGLDGAIETIPGIFSSFKPNRIERIVLQSEYDLYGKVIMTFDIDTEEGPDLIKERFGEEALEITRRLANDVDRGIKLVPVPDDDRDHNPE